MKKTKNILLVLLATMGLLTAGTAQGAFADWWSMIKDFVPRSTNTVDIGSTSNRVKKIWTVDLDNSGIFTLGGTVGV